MTVRVPNEAKAKRRKHPARKPRHAVTCTACGTMLASPLYVLADGRCGDCARFGQRAERNAAYAAECVAAEAQDETDADTAALVDAGPVECSGCGQPIDLDRAPLPVLRAIGRGVPPKCRSCWQRVPKPAPRPAPIIPSHPAQALGQPRAA